MIHRYSKKNLLQLCTLLLLAMHFTAHCASNDSWLSESDPFGFGQNQPPKEESLESKLCRAIEKDEFKTVKHLLDSGVSIGLNPLNLCHPLKFAKTPEMINFLINQEALQKPWPTLFQLIKGSITSGIASIDLIRCYKSILPNERVYSAKDNVLSDLVVSSYIADKKKIAHCILEDLSKDDVEKLILQVLYPHKSNILTFITNYSIILSESSRDKDKQQRNSLQELKAYLEEQLKWAQTEDVNIKPAKTE